MITFTGMIKSLDYFYVLRSCAQHLHKVNLPAALSVLKGTVGLAAAKRHYKHYTHVTTSGGPALAKGCGFYISSHFCLFEPTPNPIYLKGNVFF